MEVPALSVHWRRERADDGAQIESPTEPVRRLQQADRGALHGGGSRPDRSMGVRGGAEHQRPSLRSLERRATAFPAVEAVAHSPAAAEGKQQPMGDF